MWIPYEFDNCCSCSKEHRLFIHSRRNCPSTNTTAVSRTLLELFTIWEVVLTLNSPRHPAQVQVCFLASFESQNIPPTLGTGSDSWCMELASCSTAIDSHALRPYGACSFRSCSRSTRPRTRCKWIQAFIRIIKSHIDLTMLRTECASRCVELASR